MIEAQVGYEDIDRLCAYMEVDRFEIFSLYEEELDG